MHRALRLLSLGVAGMAEVEVAVAGSAERVAVAGQVAAPLL